MVFMGQYSTILSRVTAVIAAVMGVATVVVVVVMEEEVEVEDGAVMTRCQVSAVGCELLTGHTPSWSGSRRTSTSRTNES